MKALFNRLGLVLLLLLLLPSSTLTFAAIRVKDCAYGYGPSENNLAIELDDENPSKVFQFGYLIQDVFFEISFEGCAEMSTNKYELLCDGNTIGSLGESLLAIGMMGYQTRSRVIKSLSTAYDIIGSCRGKSLRLTIKH